MTIADLIGPIPTVAQLTALGAPFDQYEQAFTTWADSHWTSEGVAFEAADYYDRALMYYADAERLKDSDPARALVCRDRARQLVLNYRDTYLAPNSYRVQPHWTFVEGLACHAIDPQVSPEEQEKSKTAIWFMAGWMFGGFIDPIPGWFGSYVKGWSEARIVGRCLQSAVYAHRLGLKPATDTYPAWDACVTRVIDIAIGMVGDDGAIRPEGYCGEQAHFSTAILLSALAQAYRAGFTDPRIPVTIRKACEFMRTRYLTDAKTFPYLTGRCTKATGVADTDPEPDWVQRAYDLNGLIMEPFGFLYEIDGRDTDAQMVRELTTAMLSNAYLAGPKQFNQSFCSSFRACASLASRGTPVVVPSPPSPLMSALDRLETAVKALVAEVVRLRTALATAQTADEAPLNALAATVEEALTPPATV